MSRRVLDIVIPMAGRGARFQERGYREPKPLIDVAGLPMIQRVIENVTPAVDHRFTFVVLAEHARRFDLERKVKAWAGPDTSVVPLEGVTDGQACTVLAATDRLGEDRDLLIVNSDQLLDWDATEFVNWARAQEGDGAILAFEAEGDRWSFVRCDGGRVVEVSEKVRISNLATAGIYYFRRGSDFVWAARSMIERGLRVNNEFYVCPAYAPLIEKGLTIQARRIESSSVHILGTPEELEAYLARPKFSIFVPCFNVEDSVTQVLAGIPQPMIDAADEIVCVDNRSTDGTVANLERFVSNRSSGRKFVILQNQSNYRLGGSTLIAIRRAIDRGCDYLVNLHSDGQASGRDIAKLVAACDVRKMNLVLGSRFVTGSETGEYSPIRKLGNWFFIAVQRLLLRRDVRDLGALMALPLMRLRSFDFMRIPHDMGFQPLLLMELIRRHPTMEIDEIPIAWKKVGVSNVNIWSYGLQHLARCLRFCLARTFVTSREEPSLVTRVVPPNGEKPGA